MLSRLELLQHHQAYFQAAHHRLKIARGLLLELTMLRLELLYLLFMFG